MAAKPTEQEIQLAESELNDLVKDQMQYMSFFEQRYLPNTKQPAYTLAIISTLKKALHQNQMSCAQTSYNTLHALYQTYKEHAKPTAVFLLKDPQILEIFQQVAQHEKQSQSNDRGKTIFKNDKTYSEKEDLGISFLQLLLEFIEVLANKFPQTQSKQATKFHKVYTNLKNANVKFPDVYQFFDTKDKPKSQNLVSNTAGGPGTSQVVQSQKQSQKQQPQQQQQQPKKSALELKNEYDEIIKELQDMFDGYVSIVNESKNVNSSILSSLQDYKDIYESWGEQIIEFKQNLQLCKPSPISGDDVDYLDAFKEIVENYCQEYNKLEKLGFKQDPYFHFRINTLRRIEPFVEAELDLEKEEQKHFHSSQEQFQQSQKPSDFDAFGQPGQTIKPQQNNQDFGNDFGQFENTSKKQVHFDNPYGQNSGRQAQQQQEERERQERLEKEERDRKNRERERREQEERERRNREEQQRKLEQERQVAYNLTHNQDDQNSKGGGFGQLFGGNNNNSQKRGSNNNFGQSQQQQQGAYQQKPQQFNNEFFEDAEDYYKGNNNNQQQQNQQQQNQPSRYEQQKRRQMEIFDEQFSMASMSVASATSQDFPMKNKEIIDKNVYEGRQITYDRTIESLVEASKINPSLVRKFKMANLKKKALLIDNNEVQFGIKSQLIFDYLTSKYHLVMELFIGNKSPNPIQNIQIQYFGDNSSELWKKKKGDDIKETIEPSSQQKQEFVVQYQQAPYDIINGEFQALVNNTKQVGQKFFIPMLLTKFMVFKETDPQVFKSKWQWKRDNILKSDIFTISTRIIKHPSDFIKYFDKCLEFNSLEKFLQQRKQQGEEQMQCYELGGIFELNTPNIEYLIKITVRPNLTAIIQIIPFSYYVKTAETLMHHLVYIFSKQPNQ